MPKLHICTVASDGEKSARLIQSGINANSNVNAFKFTNWDHGNICKIMYMKLVLETIPDDDVVCFIDAYDVLCMANEDEILQKFLSFHCNIVFSSELNCHPEIFRSKYDQYYQENPPLEMTKHIFLNAGGYIGYCRDIRYMLNWKPFTEIQKMCPNGSDQYYFADFYLHHVMNPVESFKTVLDSWQHIFQSIYRVSISDLEFVHGRVYNKVLKTFPCFIHFNGLNRIKYMMINGHEQKIENIMDVFLSNMDTTKYKTKELYFYMEKYFFIDDVFHTELPQI